MATIHDNQTAILDWLRSRGHRIEGDPDFKTRSCTSKRRFADAVTARATGGAKVNIYGCPFCLGFHIATPPRAEI